MRVKDLLKVLPILLFSLFAQANSAQISAQKLLTLVEKDQAPIILDVRTAQEFEQGHIEGAINIAYDALVNNSNLLEAYRDQPIVIYCRSGRRAQHAHQTLHNKGFTQLTALQGHMNLWQARRYPLIKGN